jgi:sugar phosphate isomerase/epimerase
MPIIDRRSFLALAAAGAIPARARILQVVGVQLYTVRKVLPAKPLETLRAIEQIGYTEVEATGDNLDKIWSALKQTSLKAVSVHLDEELFLHPSPKLDAALEDAKKRGFEYVVCPYIPPKERGGPPVMRHLGETLNKAGATCQNLGLQLCYHSHAFEYKPAQEGRLLDVLMQSTDPKLVSLELDVMWAYVAGVDPVSVIKQYGSRIPLMHLKNVAAGVSKRFNEDIPASAFRDLGSGELQIAPVLSAAAEAGVKHYFVEQDFAPGDPLEALRKSFEYLKKLDF